MTADATLAGQVGELMPRALADLRDLVGYNSEFVPEHAGDCRAAADWVAGAMSDAGLTQVDSPVTPDGSTAVIGRRPAPAGAPTVLLYAHYDVQPSQDEAGWDSPPFTLTERGGRLFGRGSADCKGSLIGHLTALRALGGDIPVGVTVVAEGSEEKGGGGLDEFVPANPELFRADVVVIADSGNVATGVPTFTTALRGLVNATLTISASRDILHSGMFGGAAPDPLAALIAVLATMRDGTGATTIDGLPATGRWSGRPYPPEAFRTEAGLLPGVRLPGEGGADAIADRLWAQPALTVIGIDVPTVAGAATTIQASVAAKLSLRIPPGVAAKDAMTALTSHINAAVPWGLTADIDFDAPGEAFAADPGGPAHQAMATAMRTAYGQEVAQTGQGGSIPLTNVLAGTFPDAEIMLTGVVDPQSLIHAQNESVDPAQIEHLALAEALFLRAYR